MANFCFGCRHNVCDRCDKGAPLFFHEYKDHFRVVKGGKDGK